MKSKLFVDLEKILCLHPNITVKYVQIKEYWKLKVKKHGAHCFVIEWNNWKSFEICKCDVSSSLSLLLEQNMCCPQHSQLLLFEVVLGLLV
jgi:hypothetical protein